MKWDRLLIYGAIGVGAYLLYKKLYGFTPTPIKSDVLRDGGVSVNTGIVPPHIASSSTLTSSTAAPSIVADNTNDGQVYVPRVWASKGDEFWDVEV